MAGQKYLGCPERLWTIAKIKDILKQLNTPDRSKLKGRPAIFAKLKTELDRLNINTYDALKAHLGGDSSLPSPPTTDSPTQPPPQAPSPSSDGQDHPVTEPVHTPRRRERTLSTHVDLESMGVVYGKWYPIQNNQRAVPLHNTIAGPGVLGNDFCFNTLAEYKQKTNDKDQDFSLAVNQLRLRFSADGSYYFAADADVSKGSCQKYFSRGRGPCWGSPTGLPSESSALDACIMAGIFLDAGRTEADYGNLPSSDWLKELPEIQNIFLRTMNLDWKNHSLEASRRKKGMLLKELDSSNIMSVSAIWSNCFKNFHQFTFHTGCRCGHKKKDNLRQYNKVAVTPKDDKDMECLLREYFAFSNSKSRQCAKCALRKGRTIYGDLPPRLVVEPESDGDHVIPGSTSASISFDYRNEVGERNTAFYRWIGGIYEGQEGAERTHRVYWIDGPPNQDPAQLKIYGSREPHHKDDNPSNLGAVVGGVQPALPEQSVHLPWAKLPVLLFYERVGEIVRGSDVPPVSTVTQKRNDNRASWGVNTTTKTDEPTMAVDQELSKQTDSQKRKPQADETAGKQPASKKAKRCEPQGPSGKVDEAQSKPDHHPAPKARNASKKTAESQMPKGQETKSDGAVEQDGGAPLESISENVQRKPQKSVGGKPPATARRPSEVSKSTGRSFPQEAKGVALPKRKLRRAIAVSNVEEDRPAKRQRHDEQPTDSKDALPDDSPVDSGEALADGSQIESPKELTSDSPITTEKQVPAVTVGRTARKQPVTVRPTTDGKGVPDVIPDADDPPTAGGEQVSDEMPDADDHPSTGGSQVSDEMPDDDGSTMEPADDHPTTGGKSLSTLSLVFPNNSFPDATFDPASDASKESGISREDQSSTQEENTNQASTSSAQEENTSQASTSSAQEENSSQASPSSSPSAAASSAFASLFSGSSSPHDDPAPNPSSSSPSEETAPEQQLPAQQDQPSNQDEPSNQSTPSPVSSSSLEEGEIKSSSPEEGEVREFIEQVSPQHQSPRRSPRHRSPPRRQDTFSQRGGRGRRS